MAATSSGWIPRRWAALHASRPADADQITLVNSGLTGGLTIDAGDGGNVVKLETVTVGSDTRITSGKDVDQITLVNTA